MYIMHWNLFQLKSKLHVVYMAKNYHHSIGMNTRATHLKFVCQRMTHYACY